MLTIQQEDLKSRAQIVGEVMGRAVTRGELSKAFDRVTNTSNWKMPIDAVVDLNDREMATIREAVVFFTGSMPTFEARAGATLPRCRYRVRADGYYKTCGA